MKVLMFRASGEAFYKDMEYVGRVLEYVDPLVRVLAGPLALLRRMK